MLQTEQAEHELTWHISEHAVWIQKLAFMCLGNLHLLPLVRSVNETPQTTALIDE